MPGPRSRTSRALSFLLAFSLVFAMVPGALAETPVAIPDGAPGAITSVYGAEIDAHLGYDVACDGDIVAIGVPDASSGGEVAIYRRTGAGLELQATIVGPDGGDFGYSVDISGDTLLVGAPLVNSADGRAYFYRETDGLWSLETSITGAAARVERAGSDVSVESTTAVIGSPGFMTNRGMATFMSDLGDGWVVTGAYASASSGDYMGRSVAAANGSALVGAPGYLTSRGVGRYFTWDGITWGLARSMVGLTGDQLGYSVAMQGSVAALGAPTSDRGATDSGYVLVCELPLMTTSVDVEPEGDRVANDLFGSSVSIDSGVLAVGARGYAGTGRAVTFVGGGTSWAQNGAFTSPDTSTNFGTSVSNLGGNIIVGDPYNDRAFKDGGAAHEFSSDWFVGAEDTTLTIPAPGVLANDYDADGDPLEAYVVNDAAHGDLILEADGSFMYVPDPDHEGFDSFTYRTYDGSTYSTPTVASVYLTPVNDAPEFMQSSPTTVTCSEDENPTSFTLTLDVDDPDAGDTVVWGISAQATHGTASVSGTGLSKSISYSPDVNYNGMDSFVVRVNDDARVYAYMTVDVIVDPINDPPAFDLSASYTAPEDAGPRTVPNIATSITPGSYSYWTSIAGRPVYVTEPIANEAGQTLSANTVNDNPALFTVQPSISVTGTLTFEPAPNAYGSATVSYGITDDATAGAPGSITTTKTITVNITAVNDAPVGGADSYAVAEDESVVIGQPGLLLNDTDVEASPLTAHLYEDVPDGSLFMFENGSFIYSPPDGWSGIETFTYRAYDGALYSEPVTVTIDVGAVNDMPVIDQGGTVSATCDEDTSVDVTLTASDADGDALTWTTVTRPHDGAVSIISADTTAVVTYTPAADFFGTDAFTVQVADGSGGTDLIVMQIEVAPVNDAPMATGDVYEVAEGTALTTTAPGVLGNDTDLDGDTLSAVLDADTTHGELTLDVDGSFTYEPAADWSGTDTFTYRASDGDLLSDPVEVTLDVRSFHTAYTAVEGRDRFMTAVAASQLAYPDSADAVVIATAYNWPDALAGSGLAGAVDGPVLLTRPDGLPSETLLEVQRLGATRAYVLGGEAAASAAVLGALEAELGAGNAIRIGGATRYETAALVGAETIAQLGAEWDHTVMLATGVDFPDAISASPLSAAAGWPILLVPSTSADTALAAELIALDVEQAVILGGDASVPFSTEKDLAAAGITSERMAGFDRYATSTAIASYGATHAGLSWEVVGIATGLDFPDAFAGGIACARRGGVLVLNPSDRVTDSLRSTFIEHRPQIDEVLYFGGTAVLTQDVRDMVRNILR